MRSCPRTAMHHIGSRVMMSPTWFTRCAWAAKVPGGKKVANEAPGTRALKSAAIFQYSFGSARSCCERTRMESQSSSPMIEGGRNILHSKSGGNFQRPKKALRCHSSCGTCFVAGWLALHQGASRYDVRIRGGRGHGIADVEREVA